MVWVTGLALQYDGALQASGPSPPGQGRGVARQRSVEGTSGLGTYGSPSPKRGASRNALLLKVLIFPL